ncbi:capsid cement protein [Methylomagnum sp.]
MQTGIPLLPLTMTASGAVTAMRWVDGTGARADATDLLRGVARTDAAAGEAFPVDLLGVVRVEAGAAVSALARVGSDSVGRAVAVTPGKLKSAVIAGGSAGNLTVTGLAATDELIAVTRFDVATDTGTSASGNKVQAVADLTSEFTISAANTINNTDGTDTTGDTLSVLYRQVKPIGGIALSAAGAAGQFVDVLLIPQAVA